MVLYTGRCLHIPIYGFTMARLMRDVSSHLLSLRTQIACCVLGALMAGIVAGSAAMVLASGVTSRDWKTLKLEPVVKEAKVQALRGQPAGELIIRLDADVQSYSKQMVR